MLNSIARQASWLSSCRSIGIRFYTLAKLWHLVSHFYLSPGAGCVVFLCMARHTLYNKATRCQAKCGRDFITVKPAQAVEYLHKLKVVLLATKHLIVRLNQQPSIHQLMVR